MLSNIARFGFVALACTLLGACAGQPKDPAAMAGDDMPTRAGKDANVLNQGLTAVTNLGKRNPVENFVGFWNSQNPTKIQDPGEDLGRRLLTADGTKIVDGDGMKNFMSAAPGTAGYSDARKGIDLLNRQVIGHETDAVAPVVDYLATRLRAIEGDIRTAESAQDTGGKQGAMAALANLVPLHQKFARYQAALTSVRNSQALFTLAGLKPKMVIDAAGLIEIQAPISANLYQSALGNTATAGTTNNSSAQMAAAAPKEIAPGRYERPAGQQ